MMPIQELTSTNTPSIAPQVDIVVIHGLFESAIETCTSSKTGTVWIRDLFPHQQYKSRILTYDYERRTLLTPGNGIVDPLLNLATSFVSELNAERSLTGAFNRPLIFICHGFGGLLLKRALAWSHSRLAKQTEHLRSIYVSTYAILFIGTPHYGIQKTALKLWSKTKTSGSSQFMISLLKGSEMLNEVTDQFAPLMKQFRIYNFWEELESQVGDVKTYIVNRGSAAPVWDNTEQCGLISKHDLMIKFHSQNDPGYRVVLEALVRYTSTASKIVEHRWATEKNFLAIEHQKQVEALLQPQEGFWASIEADVTETNEIFFVPRCSSHQFTGRELYAHILKENFGLHQSQEVRNEHKIIVIYGLGGSGKTQFCLRYAEDNRTHYWGVFWVDASTRKNAEAAFASFGEQAGKGATFAAGKYWLSQCTKPWLMVVDNADDPEMDIAEFFPAGGNGHILVTTRNQNATVYATVPPIRFRGMDPEEAISLLLRSAYPKNEALESNLQTRNLAQSIAAELGYLPLALTQAGATIRRNIYTLEKYLHFYLSYRDRLLPKSTSVSTNEANAITTWEIPFQRIEKQQSLECKDAVELMHIFAFLHFESILEYLFRRSTIISEGSQLSDVIIPSIIRDCSTRTEGSHARLRRAFGVLCEYSLIDHDADRETCSLHPVIHRWARDRLTAQEQDFWLSCTTGFLAGCISLNLEASGRSFRRLLIPHINSCLRNLKYQNSSFPNSIGCANSIERFAWVYAENGLWKEALDLQEKVVAYRINALGKRHEDTIRAISSIGQTYWNLFEIRSAIEVQVRVLKMRWWLRPSFANWATWPPWKPDHISYCAALNDLTLTLWLAGRRETSSITGKRAMDGFLKRLGPDDPKTLDAMFNLARTYLHLGYLEKSHELLILVLTKRKKLFGLDHPDTLMTRNELGMVFCAGKQHLAIAEKLVGNVLKARKRVLGEEHAYTLWSVNDLSKVLCERGRPKEASKMLEEIIPVVIRTLGKEHVGMTMTKSNLARAYILSKRWLEAEELLRQMLAIMGNDHPDWIHAMSGYVHVQIQLDRLEEAERDCKTMLERILREKLLAPDHPRTLAIAEQLAQIYSLTGRHDEVVALKAAYQGMNEKNTDKRWYFLPRRRQS